MITLLSIICLFVVLYQLVEIVQLRKENRKLRQEAAKKDQILETIKKTWDEIGRNQIELMLLEINERLLD